ncbi:MAG: type II toxin-antitoxin system prevent-host-death family antitoxin [Caldilineaceae bacterium]|nr:type II toxin-antitoxin system prevent-host-death family antitoxin [Caldilineaceae bacterium]
MKIFPVGEFKAHFAEIIEQVRSGEEIIITYEQNETY